MNNSDKKFTSITSGRQCTPAQFIAEQILLNLAAKEKIKLTAGFWNNYPWNVRYKQQIIAANSLLKIYSAESIIAALNNKDTKWITSLRVKKLQEYIQVEEEKLTQVAKKIEESKPIIVNDPNSYKSINLGTTSRLGKLRD